MGKKHSAIAGGVVIALLVWLNFYTSKEHPSTAPALQNPTTTPLLSNNTGQENPARKIKKSRAETLAELKQEKQICDQTKPTHGREVKEAKSQAAPALSRFLPTNNPLSLLPYQQHSSFPPIIWTKFVFQENAKAVLAELPSVDSIEALLPNLENVQTFDDPQRAFEYVLDNVPDKSSYLFLGAMKINGQNLISANSLLLFNHNQFTDDQFVNFVTSRKFSVHEVAAAMQVNMPKERLHMVMDNSEELSMLPAFQYDLSAAPPLNLADIAVIENDLDTLVYLQKKGVVATDIPGYISAIDHVIYNLYSAQITSEDTLENHPELEKAQNLIRYLLQRGYRAHVSEFINDATPHIQMQIGFGQNAIVKLDEVLTQALLDVGYDNTTAFSLYTAKQPELLSAIKEASEIIENGRKLVAQCNALDERITAAEQLKAPRLYIRVNKAQKEFENDITGLQDYLHRIDPAAIDILYNNFEFRLAFNQDEKDADFSRLARFDKQGTIDYVTRYPLSELATNTLFEYLFANPALLDAWQSRVQPIPVSSFRALRFADVNAIETLLDEGLDAFSSDKWERGMLTTALLTSQETTRLLIEAGVVPTNPTYGPDALDIVLDSMYENGELHHAFDFVLRHLIADKEDVENNHFSRMARLREYHQALFEDIIDAHPYLNPPASQPLNRYLTTRVR